MVTAIVGNNDGSDGNHVCMRMCKDLEGLLESKNTHARLQERFNDAERLVLHRHDNSVDEGGVSARDGAQPLHGRESLNMQSSQICSILGVPGFVSIRRWRAFLEPWDPHRSFGNGAIPFAARGTGVHCTGR